MSIRTKGRRKIIVGNQTYVWYVALDYDTPYNVLNIASDDKCLILSCPLKTKIAYVISKDRTFQAKETNGTWNRYLLPFDTPDIITPKFVEKLIVWATQSEKAKETKWNGNDVPV